jgi:MerR family mercuric resistance operon transcriptional regulator
MQGITKARVSTVSIGELSRLTGVGTDTIRYFEKVEMLPKPRRLANGRRVYGAAEMRTLAFIRRARELGFSPNEVRGLLALGGPGKATCADIKKVAAHHLEGIRAKIADLAKLERLLATTISKCSGTRVPECPVIEILDIERAA